MLSFFMFSKMEVGFMQNRCIEQIGHTTDRTRPTPLQTYTASGPKISSSS